MTKKSTLPGEILDALAKGGYATEARDSRGRLLWSITHGDLTVDQGEITTPQRPGYQKKPISFKLRWAVWLRDDFQCQACGQREDLAADHIVPESKGGQTNLSNLQTLCRVCNSSKGAKLP